LTKSNLLTLDFLVLNWQSFSIACLFFKWLPHFWIEMYFTWLVRHNAFIFTRLRRVIVVKDNLWLCISHSLIQLNLILVYWVPQSRCRLHLKYICLVKSDRSRRRWNINDELVFGINFINQPLADNIVNCLAVDPIRNVKQCNID